MSAGSGVNGGAGVILSRSWRVEEGFVAKESGVGTFLLELICASDICSTVAREPLRECVLGNINK